MRPPPPTRDLALVQIVDATVSESVQRGGERVVCRPGCTSCCLGLFAITGLDALRLRRGLVLLAARDARRAAAVRERARHYTAAIAALYPGDATTGALTDEAGLQEDWDDQPCPALDPSSGLCDLYEHRPLTCRVFGPALRWSDGAVGACELCYEGASDDEIARRAVTVRHEAEERALLAELNLPDTIVAFALALPGESQ